VARLLSESEGNGGLLSPTHGVIPDISDSSGQATVKDLIELAILRGNASTPSKLSPNRFDIHRGGQRVATIMLTRSAYRLGERLIAGLDFRDALVPCYAVHAFLETVEEVDESIALRSNASITRATRRIQASCFENSICARRLSLGFMIPTTAAPEFRTSSVQLKWNLRIEFTTGKESSDSADEGLIEEVAEDERGRVLAAAQELPCESFDVLVPIRVYGSIGEISESLPMTAAI
jgi:RAB6A-GEF complex partner protein 2